MLIVCHSFNYLFPTDNGICPSWAQYSQCFCVIPTTTNHNLYEYDRHHINTDLQQQQNLIHNESSESNVSQIQQLEDSLIRNYGHIFQVIIG